MSEDGFLSRWARRKAEVRAGRSVDEAPTPPDAAPERPAAAEARPAAALTSAVTPAVAVREPAAGETVPATASSAPPPTLEEATALAPGAEVSRFVRRGIDTVVQRAALKKLFADPHFNIMDGLDTYIDDYGQPDPIPAAMLRQLNQSKFLGLFEDQETTQTADATTGPAAAPPTAQDAGPAEPAAVPQAAHEDPDLQLQPDDAAGRPGAEERAGPERA